MVDSRCAMTMEVRRFITASSPSWISVSVSGSMLAVASSRMKIDGSCSRTRASATSCRWPIERLLPRSPTSVSRPFRQAVQPVAAADLPRDAEHVVVASRRRSRSGCYRAPCRRTGTASASRCPDGCGSCSRSSVRISCPSIRMLPALELVEARDQLGDARLARAGVPDQRQRFARAGSSARSRCSTGFVFACS